MAFPVNEGNNLQIDLELITTIRTVSMKALYVYIVAIVDKHNYTPVCQKFSLNAFHIIAIHVHLSVFPPIACVTFV